jgi:hypothetical protein
MCAQHQLSGLPLPCLERQGKRNTLTGRRYRGGTLYGLVGLQDVSFRMIERRASALFERIWRPASLILTSGLTATRNVFLGCLFVKLVRSLISG